MVHSIRFLNEEAYVCVPAGVSLLSAWRMAGLTPDAPCGGRGTCGKCLVDIRCPGQTEWRRVNACQTQVDEDLEVRTLFPEARRMLVLDRGEPDAAFPRMPWIQIVPLSVAPCPPGQSISLWSRLTAALEIATGNAAWEPNFPILSQLDPLIRQTQGKIWAAVSPNRILAVRDQPQPVYMAAFDVGTTTLAGYLLEGDEVVARAGMPNSQTQYGADVIQRVDYAASNGPKVLSDCIRHDLDGLLGRLCAQASVSREQIMAVSLVGNTCMHHLFLGIPPDTLGRCPYAPVFSDRAVLSCASYGLHVHPAGELLLLPVIAGFVGADTVACLISRNWESLESLTLLIDIGTNGEIVLGDRRRLAVCSAAAGPAFEGAGIQWGMRGAPGAVDHVWLRGGEMGWSVIGGGEAIGVCGSGLIDWIAALRKAGRIDSSGRAPEGPFALGDTAVCLTQRDIRQVQLAKAAISAGILLLARHLGISMEDIQNVYLAGAFGTFLDPDSACTIGLIPGCLRSKLRPIGNAAGEGAKLALQARSAWDSAARLARKAEFLELASSPDFQDVFVDQLEFPPL